MRLLPVLTAVSLIYGCLGPQTDNKSKKTAATTDAAVLSDENGILTAEFDANSKNSQLIKASENSGIAGSEVVFPPGSLGINANITIEEGSNLANSSTLSELGLGSDNALSSAGAPLVITASEKVDASNPFTLAIPFAGTSLALAGDELLVIVYKVTKASEGGKVVVGIIPRAELTIENGKVKFATTFFGSYQPVFTEKPIETKVEAPSETPIEKKAEDATPPAKIMISGAPSGSSAVNALSVTVSGDDVSYYKYSLIIYASYGCDKANYGDEKEVSLPISDDLNTFGAGNMMLCVIGRDSNGNWMSAANAAKATWTRTTTTAAAVPFAIAASSPVAGSSAAAITGIIAVTFTDNVDQSTVASSTTIANAQSQNIAFTPAVSGKVLTLTTTNMLHLGSQYTVTFSTNLKSTSGVALTAAQSINFTAVPGSWDAIRTVNTVVASLSDLSVASNAKGQIFVTWKEGASLVYKYQYFNGTKWQDNEGSTSTTYPVKSIVLSNGTVYFAYTETNQVKIYKAAYDANNLSFGTSGGFTFTGPQEYPQSLDLGVTAGDKVYLAWLNYLSGSYYSVKYANNNTSDVFSPLHDVESSTYSTELLLAKGIGATPCLLWNANSTGKVGCGLASPLTTSTISGSFDASHDKLVTGGSSQAALLYDYNVSQGNNLSYRLYNGTTWSGDTPLVNGSNTNNYISDFSLFGDANNFWMAWTNVISGSTSSLTAARIASIKSAADLSQSTPEIASASANSVRFATDGVNRAVVAYVENGELKAKFYNGASWGIAVPIGFTSPNSYQLVMDENGITTFVWSDGATDNHLFAARYSTSNSSAVNVPANVQLSSASAINQVLGASAAKDNSGRVNAVWLNYVSGAGYNVFNKSFKE